MQNKEKVFCGAQKVDKQEKESFVNNIFSSVHSKYDLMNDLMSFGMHRCWKSKFIDLMKRALIYKPDAKIIDVGSGSGDIGIKFLKTIDRNLSKPHVTLTDINQDMLCIARKRIINENLFKFCDVKIADASELPFEDCQFDLYTISFAIRNVADMPKALNEAFRVLKTNGQFICMEFSPIKQDGIKKQIYNIYTKKIIPIIGAKVTGDKAAYEYLADSIDTFPCKQDFKEMIERAGFENLRTYELNLGSVVIYTGIKCD